VVAPGIPSIPGRNPTLPGLPPGDMPITTPVPEPSTYALMALGLALVIWMSRRRPSRGG
jgi:hypothetical protein